MHLLLSLLLWLTEKDPAAGGVCVSGVRFCLLLLLTT